MILLTDDEKRKYKKQKHCHICKKEFCADKDNQSEYKIYHKVRDHCHYSGKYKSAAHSICNLRYKDPRENPVVLHNGSKYGFHLIIQELAEQFKSEKYITFAVPLKKKTKNKKLVTDSCRFMNTSLSSLTDNLSEINNKECKRWMERNKTKSDCQYTKHKDNRLVYKCK